MSGRDSSKKSARKGKATGWPRPERKLSHNLGLNPMRMAALVILALAGVFGGYLLGKYVKPSASLPEISTSASQSSIEPKKTDTLSTPEGYEESLPRDIVIQQDGKLRRIALPEPDMEPDFGKFAQHQSDSLPVERKDTPDQPADSPVKEDDSVNESTPPEDSTAEQEEQVASLPPPTSLVRAMPEDFVTLQSTSADSLPPWLRNAVPTEFKPNTPKIVIVMDDLGLNRSRARKTLALPGPLTLAYMTYAEDLEKQIAAAKAAGHELMLHVPMEPRSETINPGPNVLLSGIPREELVKSINWNLDQADKVVGINNHMGSRFTSDREGMEAVVEILNERGLLFLDSVTSGSSVAHNVAENAGIPFAVRNVFLDHEDDLSSIKRQLRVTESVARRTGVAIAIGHPRDKTLEALEKWLPTLEERGFQLVPISSVAQIKSEKS